MVLIEGSNEIIDNKGWVASFNHSKYILLGSVFEICQIIYMQKWKSELDIL